VVNTNPGTLLGYGTWSAFGAGRMLVGLDSGDADFDTVEETGGAKTVTLTAAQSGLPQHTHTQNAHTHVQNAHNHVITSQTATTGSATSYEHGTLDTSSAETEATEVTANATAVNQDATAVNQNAGPTDASQAHNNMPPYIVCYFWKRTA
jgi:microcystin-dependent protein